MARHSVTPKPSTGHSVLQRAEAYELQREAEQSGKQRPLRKSPEEAPSRLALTLDPFMPLSLSASRASVEANEEGVGTSAVAAAPGKGKMAPRISLLSAEQGLDPSDFVSPAPKKPGNANEETSSAATSSAPPVAKKRSTAKRGIIQSGNEGGSGDGIDLEAQAPKTKKNGYESKIDVRPPLNTRAIKPKKEFKTNQWMPKTAAKNWLLPGGVAAYQIAAMSLFMYLFNQVFKQSPTVLASLNAPTTSNTTTTTYAAGTMDPQTVAVANTSANAFLGFLPKAEQVQLLFAAYSFFVVMVESKNSLMGATKGAFLTKIGAMSRNHEASMEIVKPWLMDEPEDIKNAVMRIDAKILDLVSPFPKTVPIDPTVGTDPGVSEVQEEVKLLQHFRDDILLERPFKRKEVELAKTPEGRKILRAKIEEAIKDYDEDYKIFCRSTLITLAMRSIDLDDKSKRRKFIVELRGLTGTGKDHLFRMIEEILGIPIDEIYIPPDEMEGPAALLGRPWDAILASGSKPPTNDHALLGLILGAIFRARCTNAFLNFPEVDWTHKGIRNMFKIVGDPGNQYIEIKGVGIKFFVGDMNIGTTSNDEEFEGATRDRNSKFGYFKKVSPKAREISALKRFNDTSSEYFAAISQNGSMPPAQVDKQRREVKQLFDKVFPYLLHQANGDLDAKPPRIPASARMLFVEDLTHYICDRVDAGEPPTTKNLKNYISDFYNNRTPGESVDEAGFFPTTQGGLIKELSRQTVLDFFDDYDHEKENLRKDKREELLQEVRATKGYSHLSEDENREVEKEVFSAHPPLGLHQRKKLGEVLDYNMPEIRRKLILAMNLLEGGKSHQELQRDQVGAVSGVAKDLASRVLEYDLKGEALPSYTIDRLIDNLIAKHTKGMGGGPSSS